MCTSFIAFCPVISSSSTTPKPYTSTFSNAAHDEAGEAPEAPPPPAAAPAAPPAPPDPPPPPPPPPAAAAAAAAAADLRGPGRLRGASSVGAPDCTDTLAPLPRAKPKSDSCRGGGSERGWGSGEGRQETGPQQGRGRGGRGVDTIDWWPGEWRRASVDECEARSEQAMEECTLCSSALKQTRHACHKPQLEWSC